MKEREPAIRAKQGAKPKSYIRKKKFFQESPNSNVKLYARIKKTSKYHGQVLELNGKPSFFQVDAIQQGFHAFYLNNNIYRLQDLSFYVKDENGHFLKLSFMEP